MNESPSARELRMAQLIRDLSLVVGEVSDRVTALERERLAVDFQAETGLNGKAPRSALRALPGPNR